MARRRSKSMIGAFVNKDPSGFKRDARRKTSSKGRTYYVLKKGTVKYVGYKKGSRFMIKSYYIKHPGRRKRRKGYDSFSLSKGYHNWARS